jgi:hypothetical protein
MYPKIKDTPDTSKREFKQVWDGATTEDWSWGMAVSAAGKMGRSPTW